MKLIKVLSALGFSLLVVLDLSAQGVVNQPGISTGPGVKYATDAYPGFDSEDEIVSPSKKEPLWPSCFRGPKKDNPSEQYAWSNEQAIDGSISAAIKGYDALVREWPSSVEAPKAQRNIIDLLLKDEDYEEAFKEMRYMLDFYSTQCNYSEITALMYDTVKKMREEGKWFLCFHFANTVDVRRAYEALVLHAPGARFVPEAMMTIAKLRVDEGKFGFAIAVYENIRNLYPESKAATLSYVAEAAVRMELLEDHEYNRARSRDTINFIKLALRNTTSVDGVNKLNEFLKEATDINDRETWQAAEFYDSSTRTKRSSINAYKRYLLDYPNGLYAEDAKERIAELEEDM